MKVGLLWHDSSSSDLARKLSRAVQRYQVRFGQPPNVCYVHPTQLPEGKLTVGSLTIRASQQVLRHHFWLGQETADGS